MNVQAERSDPRPPGVIGMSERPIGRALETRIRSNAPSNPTMLPSFGWGDPVRTLGNEKQASSVRTFGGSARPKKPVRRCFKLRPPWSAGFAGLTLRLPVVVGARQSTARRGIHLKRRPEGSTPVDHRSLGSWRLSGLLSGCPPTGTRPQARAKLGKREIGSFGPVRKGPEGAERSDFARFRPAFPVGRSGPLPP